MCFSIFLEADSEVILKCIFWGASWFIQHVLFRCRSQERMNFQAIYYNYNMKRTWNRGFGCFSQFLKCKQVKKVTLPICSQIRRCILLENQELSYLETRLLKRTEGLKEGLIIGEIGKADVHTAITIANMPDSGDQLQQVGSMIFEKNEQSSAALHCILVEH